MNDIINKLPFAVCYMFLLIIGRGALAVLTLGISEFVRAWNEFPNSDRHYFGRDNCGGSICRRPRRY